MLKIKDDVPLEKLKEYGFEKNGEQKRKNNLKMQNINLTIKYI